MSSCCKLFRVLDCVALARKVLLGRNVAWSFVFKRFLCLNWDGVVRRLASQCSVCETHCLKEALGVYGGSFRVYREHSNKHDFLKKVFLLAVTEIPETQKYHIPMTGLNCTYPYTPLHKP